MIPVGESIKQWREYRRFSVAELARAAQVEYNTVYRIEKGTHKFGINWPELYRVAVALGVDLDQLAMGRDAC